MATGNLKALMTSTPEPPKIPVSPDDQALLASKREMFLWQCQNERRHPWDICSKEYGFPDYLIEAWEANDAEIRRIFIRAGDPPHVLARQRKSFNRPMTAMDFNAKARRNVLESGIFGIRLKQLVDKLEFKKVRVTDKDGNEREVWNDDVKVFLNLWNGPSIRALFAKESVAVNVNPEPNDPSLQPTNIEELEEEVLRMTNEAIKRKREREANQLAALKIEGPRSG